MTSKLTDIGRAIMTLLEEYEIAKDQNWIIKPISYALYQTWLRWDATEKPRQKGGD